MTEATLTGAFLKRLREEPGSVVFKHRDASTIGMPDASWTCRAKTWWFEFKAVKVSAWVEGLNFKRVLTRPYELVQMETMVALERASGRRAVYVIFVVVGKWHRVHLVSPLNVKASYHDDKLITLGSPTTVAEMKGW